MKTPCSTCPFRIDVNFYLTKDRALDIVEAILHDSSFHCHNTLEYDSINECNKVTSNSKLCFGAVLFLEHVAPGGCRSNVIFRLCIRSGEFDVDDLRKDLNIYNSVDAFIKGVSSND